MGINKIPSSSVALTRRLGGLGGLIGSSVSQRAETLWLPGLRQSYPAVSRHSPPRLSSLSRDSLFWLTQLVVAHMTWQSCVPAVTACAVSGKSSAAEVVDLSANQVTESVGWTRRHFGTLKFRWFVLWWVHVFTVSRSQQTNAGQTVIRGFTHKQTQKWCRFTLFSTWTTNTLNLHVRTSSRARKHHSKFKSFVKLLLSIVYIFIIVLVW